jgi:hypothetical protein
MRAASDAPVKPRSFSTFWEFALALNRHDASALALATDGPIGDIPIAGNEIRRLLGTVWFRSAFRSLSLPWRNRLLDVLLDGTRIHNHLVGEGRRAVRLDQVPYEELEKIAVNPGVPDVVRAEVQLLVAIGGVWGSDALTRVTFEPLAQAGRPSMFEMLLPPFRQS